LQTEIKLVKILKHETAKMQKMVTQWAAYQHQLLHLIQNCLSICQNIS